VKRTLAPIGPTIAVDPGAGYSKEAATGIVAVVGTRVVYSTNVHRRHGELVDDFARRVITRVEEVRDRPWPPEVARVVEQWGGWTFAVEGVVAPSGRIHGRKSPVTHDQVLGIGIIYGMCVGYFRGVRVRPCKAGLAHAYRCATPSGRLPCKGGHDPDRHCKAEPVGDFYPSELIGRRPPGWAGEVGTREHEQEAFDLAFAAWEQKARKELIA
jgi:hypothetical protein